MYASMTQAERNAARSELLAIAQQRQDELDALTPQDPGYGAAQVALTTAQTALAEVNTYFPSTPQAGA